MRRQSPSSDNVRAAEDDAEHKDPLGFLPFTGTAKQVANWVAVLLGVWILLNGVGMIGDGFKGIAGDRAQELFSFAENLSLIHI